MRYEIVTLERQYVAGVSLRTNNAAPDMMSKIGAAWQRLYREGLIFSIPGRIGDCAYGVYTKYESNARGDYDLVAGCQVETLDGLENVFSTALIPEGRYAKFSTVVDMEAGGVGALWSEIWRMDLPRAYTADFEEYLPVQNKKAAPVNLYIALKD